MPLVEFFKPLEDCKQILVDKCPSMSDYSWYLIKDDIIFEVGRKDGWKMLVIAKCYPNGIKKMGIVFIPPTINESEE